MKFEDMKVIWDSQNEEPLFAVNQQGLKSILEKKGREFNRLIFWQEAQTYISTTMVVALLSLALVGYYTGALEGLRGVRMTQWDAIALVLGILCWLQFALRVYFGRVHQRRLDQEHVRNLREELDRDIKKAGFEIQARRLPVLITGFIPPHIGGILFTWVVFRASGLPGWSIIPFVCVMLGGFIYETRMQLRLVETKLKPRKRELEGLLEKLTESER